MNKLIFLNLYIFLVFLYYFCTYDHLGVIKPS